MSKMRIHWPLWLLAWLLIAPHREAYGQVRAGAAFLKMLPGARLQATAGAYASVIDDPYAVYANAGATAFLREWQWSASYTKWIADVYNASVLHGRRLRTPWSSTTRIALAVSYQGMPEFDSSDRAAPMATANDMLISVGIGQRLTAISENLALGLNLKYLRSTLDRYRASTVAADAGLLVRTDRFELGLPLLKYGIVSFGASVANVGPSLTFEQVATPLPRTYRVGASFYAGTHSGLQIHLLGDYSKILDESGSVGVGAEVCWGRTLALMAGYRFSDELLDRFSLGASIRLDAVQTPGQRFFPGRANTLRFDVATLGEGEFFSRTYRGTVTFCPLKPEGFVFLFPADGDTVLNKNVVLRWERTRDPDLFDEVHIWVLLDRNPDRVKEAAKLATSEPETFFARVDSNPPVLAAKRAEGDSCLITDLGTGHYYWTVVAFDADGHPRLGGSWFRHVSHFFIPYSDIEIKDVRFEYDPWITQDDYQGLIRIEVVNRGDLVEKGFNISVLDSALSPCRSLAGEPIPTPTGIAVLLDSTVAQLRPGESVTFKIPWHTGLLGAHTITVVADARGVLSEDDRSNNVLRRVFFTIPKGKFATGDTALALTVSQVALDLPIITEICFDVNSAVVQPQYLHRTTIDPPLAVLATRLHEHPYLWIRVQGFADANSGELDTTLADLRAAAVRDSLLALGATEKQIRVEPGQVLPRRWLPANKQDAEWILQERRYVKITSNHAGQMALFQPVHHVDAEKVPVPVVYESDIFSAVPIRTALLRCSTDVAHDSCTLKDLRGEKLKGQANWTVPQPDSLWISREVRYQLELADTLGRVFRTHPSSVFLTEDVFEREYRIAFPMKFAQANPLYGFYWDRVFKQVEQMLEHPDARIRFAGFACAIGPEKINQRLSRQRAQRFHEEFLKLLEENFPDLAAKVRERLDPPKGYGESVPLQIIRLDGTKVLIGDNSKPIGRKLNRRVEVIFSREYKAKQER